MTRRTYRRRRGGDFRENMMAEARAQAPTKVISADPATKDALWGNARGSALSQLENFVQDRGRRRSPAGFLRPKGEELDAREKRFRDFAFCAQHGHRKKGAAREQCRKSGKLTALARRKLVEEGAKGESELAVYLPAYYESKPVMGFEDESDRLDDPDDFGAAFAHDFMGKDFKNVPIPLGTRRSHRLDWNKAWLPFAGRASPQGAVFDNLTLPQFTDAKVTPYANAEAEKRGMPPLVGGRKSRRVGGRKTRRGGRKSRRGGRKTRR